MKKKILSLLITLAVISSSAAPALATYAAPEEKAETGTTYYVSTLNGRDSNDGTSEDEAFYSLQKINTLDLEPGDRVLMEAGSHFINGYLHLYEQSGSEEAPIVIDKYGEGADPVIDTNGEGVWYQNYRKPLDSSSHRLNGYVSSSILLYDTEYIEINNLEIINKAPAIERAYNDLDVMNRTGVSAIAQNKGTVDHIYLNNLNIHDIIGNVYDKHMNNGGIYFTVSLPMDEAATGIARYNDVLIENCVVDHANRWGIAVGYTAYWGHFTGTTISDEAIATYGSGDVVIRNNYIKEAGGDAITTMYCDRPLIEYNVSDGAARQINTTDYAHTGSGRVAAGIWPWKCKDALFQYNEAFDTYDNQDGQAWDADSGDGTIYQYNYSHNNAGGAVMFCYPESVNNTFRYNISQNDLKGVINPAANPDAHIYNNVFYIPEGASFIRKGMAGGYINVENNIIYYAGSTPKTENWALDNTKATYSNNLYYNYANLPADANAVNAAAGTKVFVEPGTGPSATNGGVAYKHEDPAQETVFDGYKLAENSPAINAGKIIIGYDGTDFFGNPIQDKPDIGAFESDYASTGILMSFVSSVYEVKDYKIRGLEADTTVKQFLDNFTYDGRLTITVKDKDGTVLTDADIVMPGGTVTVTNGKNTDLYSIMSNSDNKIYDSVFEIRGSTIFIPSVDAVGMPADYVKAGIRVHETAEINIYDGVQELVDGMVSDGMILKVAAEDGTTNDYAISIKNDYHWSRDYVDAQQGNVWFAQEKASGRYSNMTQYSSIYATWEGADYAAVGLEGDRDVDHATKKGLLVDAMGTSSRRQGYSMAYRAPAAGITELSFDDFGEKLNAYLRMASASAPNTGSDVYLSITKNGELVNENAKIQLPNDGTGISIEPVRIEVNRGDYIRLEITNEGAGAATKGSAYVTPEITYLDESQDMDTEAPNAPSKVRVSDITENSAFVQWNASGDNTGVTGYEVSVNGTLVETVTDQTSLKLTGLSPDTQYTAEVAAIDAAGNRSAAGSVNFTTAAAAVDRSGLLSLIEKAKETDNGRGTYTAKSFEALQAAITAAEKESIRENLTEQDVLTATNALQNAINALTKVVISIDKASHSMNVGDTITLRATTNETAATVKWSSSNEGVAAVAQNGSVKGLAAGTAVIKAVIGEVSAACTVTVNKKPAPAPSLKLNKSKVTLYTKGKNTLTLKATVTGASNKVIWKTSDKKVVTVKNGKLTAKKAGKATITATANGITRNCKVTVKKASMTLKKSSVILKKGKSAKIVVKVTPKGKITYTSNNKKVAVVNKKGKVTAKKAGSAKITVKCSGMKKVFKVKVVK